MNPEQLFKAGKLTEAISALNSHLRDNPGDQKNRTFLFELLCFAGDYERADKQLNILEQESNKDSMLGTIMYKAVLNAEKTRQEMFESKSFPKQAEDKMAIPVKGKLNGVEFQSLSDGDPRIGEKLELFAAGDYLWISYADIASIKIEPPKRLRDLLWIPAKLITGPAFRSRELGETLIPAMAPLSFQHSDDEVRLGRITDFCEDEDGVISPFGRKVLLVDGQEVSFLDIRELQIYPPSVN